MNIYAKVIDKRDLTDRESEILALICEAAPDKVIARKLAISIKTVSAHCEHIYLKLQVRQASINVRCATIGNAVARGMVQLSTTALCLWLMLSTAGLDDQAIRVGRPKSAGHMSVRSRIRGIDG